MRSGKSSATVVKLIESIVTKPNQNFWIVSLDYALTSRFIFGRGEVKGIDTYLSMYLPFLVKYRDRKEHTLTLNTGTLIQGKSTKYINSFAAERVDGIIIEDAETVSNHAWENYIYGRMMDSDGFIWVNSVPPIDKSHWIYDLINKSVSDKNIRVFNFLTTDNPYCQKSFILEMKKNLPTNAYQRCIGIITQETEKAPLTSTIFSGEFSPYQPGNVYKIGIDVSRFGHSRTVVAVANYTQKRIVYIDYFPKKFMKREQFYDRIFRIIQAYNFCPVRVDSAGIGFGVYEELKKDGRVVVEDGGIKNLSRRNTVIETLILASQRGWTFPDHEELKKEFYNLTLTFKESEKTGEVKSFYVQRDKAIGTDGIMATGLALEGFYNFEGLSGFSKNTDEILSAMGAKQVYIDKETDELIHELHSELKGIKTNELEYI